MNKTNPIGLVVAAVLGTLGLGASYNWLTHSHATPAPVAAFSGTKAPANIVPMGQGSKSFVVMGGKNFGSVVVLNSNANYKDLSNESIVFNPAILPQYANPMALQGKTVTATGTLQLRNGQSQVMVQTPDGLKVH